MLKDGVAASTAEGAQCDAFGICSSKCGSFLLPGAACSYRPLAFPPLPPVGLFVHPLRRRSAPRIHSSYVPTMLVGSGGNAGNQAAVLVIRALATGNLTRAEAAYLGSEVLMALCIGSILLVAGVFRVLIFNYT